jgi:flagellar biosynthesis/type III secretory pathway protein FliH
VGLPAFDGVEYATGENLLGIALSSLMGLPAERRVELCAEGLKRIAAAAENDYRRSLLSDSLEAYAKLDEAEKDRLDALLHTEPYREVLPLMKTTYERGMEQGRERGLAEGRERGIAEGIEQGERCLTVRLMEARFGPLTPQVKQRVEALSREGLAQLQLDLLQAQSLEELHLRDG